MGAFDLRNKVPSGQDSQFRIAWWVLVVVSAIFTINHVAGIWLFASTATEAQMFELFAAVQILTLIVLLIPYRKLERWAWWATWIGIAPFAFVFVFGADGIGRLYLAVSLVLTAAQLAALPSMTASLGMASRSPTL